MVDERKKQDLYNVFENADTILQKKYVSKLDELPVVEVGKEITNIKVGSNICLYHIDKIVYDESENIHDKLTTVYSSLFANEESALVLIVKGSKEHVDLYLGAVSRKVNDQGSIPVKSLENSGKTLSSVMQGNFPGTELHRIDIERRKDDKGNYIGESVESVIKSCFSQVTTIASVSGIAALRNQGETKSGEFVQSMEKLVDAMRGKEYSAIYIADVMGNETIEDICSEYEDIYSQLSPFRQSVHTLNENNSKTDTTGIVDGVVNTTNESLAKSVTHGTTHSITKTNSIGGGVNTSATVKVGIGGTGTDVTAGISANYNHSKGKTEGVSDSEANTTTQGKAQSLTTQNSVANAITSGTGEALQITYDNRAVKTLLDRIDEQIQRLRSCEDFGLFDSCVYFISNKYEDAVSAASTYKSLIRGENSSVESSAINVWSYKKESKDIEWISQYLKRLYHPMFALQVKDEAQNGVYLPVTPALMVSGKELSFQFSLPKKSISGLPVIECAEFGRNVMSIDGSDPGQILDIGKIYHMHKVEESHVQLSVKDITSHMFITGSTGSGKSNSIYQILSKAIKETDATFLVVEPAKGEYKHVFGTNPQIDVHVYGTNPYYTPMLRLNPFRFPPTTHIYEHMDRLVELFNVCWPMYAAMPAVLKVSLEHAYEAAGWDLKTSVCRNQPVMYPSFSSVAEAVRKYIDLSEYSDENKGDYKGALVTRLESMTNGINGMIFSSNDLEDLELFDRNVIVDLSRVGSIETKALIMGILIMRLQEYRSGSMAAPNSGLKHITVLEEAHNLLKRTSSEQSSEGSNLLGKSVEMLANSIAEMRTYGEAFIIADQAPGLLDMSVIRNTNTKVILRLPDYSDRELVGKSANLTDKQILELAKLPTGTAAVYQNNWVTPVLCKFDRYRGNQTGLPGADTYYRCPDSFYPYKEGVIDSDLMALDEFHNKVESIGLEQAILNELSKPNIPSKVQEDIFQKLTIKNESSGTLTKAIYKRFHVEPVFNQIASAATIEQWRQNFIDTLPALFCGLDPQRKDSLITKLLRYHVNDHTEYQNIYLTFLQWRENRERVL
ncbi:DUF87 domain-containing protein [Lachnospiraceae bacterium 54-53]